VRASSGREALVGPRLGLRPRASADTWRARLRHRGRVACAVAARRLGPEGPRLRAPRPAASGLRLLASPRPWCSARFASRSWVRLLAVLASSLWRVGGA